MHLKFLDGKDGKKDGLYLDNQKIEIPKLFKNAKFLNFTARKV